MPNQSIPESQKNEYRRQLSEILYPPQGQLLVANDLETALRLGRYLGIEVRVRRIDLVRMVEIDLQTNEVIREF